MSDDRDDVNAVRFRAAKRELRGMLCEFREKLLADIERMEGSLRNIPDEFNNNNQKRLSKLAHTLSNRGFNYFGDKDALAIDAGDLAFYVHPDEEDYTHARPPLPDLDARRSQPLRQRRRAPRRAAESPEHADQPAG